MSDSQYAFDVTRETFAQYVIENSHKVPVLVDFWADWCAPCKALMPILARLAEEYQGRILVAKVNSDEQGELAAQFGIRSLPTVKIFKNGTVVDEFMGAQPEGVIRDMLARYIVRPSDALRNQALDALHGGDAAKALTLLEQAIAMDPDYPALKIDLAGLHLQMGQDAQAKTILEALPAEVREQDEVRQLLSQLHYASLAEGAPDAATLRAGIEQDPADLAARQQLAALSIAAGDFETALAQFLEIMKRDRGFNDDAGRKGLLEVFDMLGGGEQVQRYRRQMANLLL